MSLFSLGSSLVRRPRPLRSDWYDTAPHSGLELRFGPAAVLVRPNGPSVDASDATEVVSAVREATTERKAPRRFLIDLSAVDVPSSMAIGMLLELARLADEAGATCHLHASHRFVEVLRMLRLDGRYTMVRDARRLDDLLR